MADFQDTVTVSASSQAVFDYVADVTHLPQYFARMTSAVRGDDDEVITTAALPDGRLVEGKAWFRADVDDRSIAWGAEGANHYHGAVDVRAAGDGRCEVEVRVHTNRVPDGDPEVQQGVRETAANIKNLVETS